MGADMIVATMRAPWQTSPKPSYFYDTDLALAVGLRRIDTHDFAAMGIEALQLAENLGLGEVVTDPEYKPTGKFLPSDAYEGGAEISFAEACELVRAELRRLLPELIGYRRDVADITVAGQRVWVTGGLSWGDSPTDALEWVAAFDWIGLFDRAIDDPADRPLAPGDVVEHVTKDLDPRAIGKVGTGTFEMPDGEHDEPWLTLLLHADHETQPLPQRNYRRLEAPAPSRRYIDLGEGISLDTPEGVSYAPYIAAHLSEHDPSVVTYLEVGVKATHTDWTEEHKVSLVPSTEASGEPEGNGNVFLYEDDEAVTHLAWSITEGEQA